MDAGPVNQDDPVQRLRQECRILWEDCLYTQVSQLIWLRTLRKLKYAFISLGVICGGIAGTQAIAADFTFWAGICGAIAGIVPLVMSALKLDENIEHLRLVSGRFTALKDDFRQADDVWSHNWTYEAFEAECRRLFAAVAELKEESITPPDWAFERARKKIKAGRYKHDADESN